MPKFHALKMKPLTDSCVILCLVSRITRPSHIGSRKSQHYMQWSYAKTSSGHCVNIVHFQYVIPFLSTTVAALVAPAPE